MAGGFDTAPRLVARGLRVVLSRGAAPVLEGIDLALAPGWTAIVGPNGAGKSTLLRALAGLQHVDQGAVELDGVALTGITARHRARRLAWLPQAGPADSELSVHAVVHLGRLPHLGLHGAPTATDEALVQQAMRSAGCAELQDRPLHALSGGERQRVLLARALAVDAPIALLDEPIAHLDPRHRLAVAALLRRLAGEGRTVVSVLHEVSMALRADRIAVLAGGRLIAYGAAGDAAVHRALMSAFDEALEVRLIDGRWHAVAAAD